MKLRTQYKLTAWLYNAIFIILAATSLMIYWDYRQQSQAAIKVIESTFQQPVEVEVDQAEMDRLAAVTPAQIKRIEELTAKVESGADLTAQEQAEINRILNK